MDEKEQRPFFCSDRPFLTRNPHLFKSCSFNKKINSILNNNLPPSKKIKKTQENKVIRTYKCSLEPPEYLMKPLREAIKRKQKRHSEPFAYDYDILKEKYRNSTLTVNTYRKTAAESLRMLCRHFSAQAVNFADYIRQIYEKNLYFANVKHQAFPISNLNICNEFNCAIPNRLVNSRFYGVRGIEIPSLTTLRFDS